MARRFRRGRDSVAFSNRRLPRDDYGLLSLFDADREVMRSVFDDVRQDGIEAATEGSGPTLELDLPRGAGSSLGGSRRGSGVPLYGRVMRPIPFSKSGFVARVPSQVRFCVQRKARRESLFALRRIGFKRSSPGGSGGYRRNENSNWGC